MNQLQKELVDKFVMDPDWPKMQAYICDFLLPSTDIDSIDTNMPSDAVHAEVIARKDIKARLKEMTDDFETYRNPTVPEVVSFK